MCFALYKSYGDHKICTCPHVIQTTDHQAGCRKYSGFHSSCATTQCTNPKEDSQLRFV